ncbi:MAG: hypothetical protein MZW92_70105 [Comamonadaceae bacterium]|nr:hypothetical protein [Comamonadaceae bacterium]
MDSARRRCIDPEAALAAAVQADERPHVDVLDARLAERRRRRYVNGRRRGTSCIAVAALAASAVGLLVE